MSWWGERVLPRLIDRMLGAPDGDEYRIRACAGLSGDVLELGFGSGLNVAHYPAGVRTVHAVEPSDLAWRLAGPRVAAGPAEVVRSGLDGQRLELPDASVDHALSTMTMCTIPDLPAALAEVRRVLRPGGRLHFLEHGHAPDPAVAGWQRRLDPLQGRLFGGCHLSRPIDRLLLDAGFALDDLDTFYLPGPRAMRVFGYTYLGRAHPGTGKGQPAGRLR